MKASTRYRATLAVAAGLAAVTTLGAGLAALGLSRPDAAAGFATDLAPVREARADRAAGLVAQAETRAALAQAPMNAALWARLSWLEQQAAGTMTRQAKAALDRSYAVAPYGPDITEWRLTFAFEHWTELDPPLRRSVMDEMETLARHRPGVARKVAGAVRSPGGRLAARLTFDLGNRKGRLARQAKTEASA